MKDKETESICPVCSKVIPAKIIEENNKIFLVKTCEEHGFFKELYWGDAELFKQFDEFKTNGFNPENPLIESKKGCPFDCGLCEKHESNGLLGIIDVTNNCNLRCHYCFANAGVTGYLYEPSFKELETAMDALRNQKPIAVPAVMFSGGEPTLRKDIVELVKKAKEKGFGQVFIATNGIKIANDIELAKQLKNAGVTTIYLKFNGLTKKTNIENLLFIPKILENCRKTGLQITLVPTIINGFNNHEIYDIVHFALNNLDIVRAVNFQPISFCGQMNPTQRKQQRITIPDVLIELEKQSNNLIPLKSFYPIPAVNPLPILAEKILNKKHPLFSAHPHCGAATYLFKDGEKIIPITEFIKVDSLLKEVNEVLKKDWSSLKKIKRLNEIKKILKKNIINEKKPSYLKLSELVYKLLTGNYDKLTDFHLKTLFIGTMHFQDPHNLDIQRLKKCVILYATPQGKLVPFCAYNGLHYRKEIEKENSKPLK